MIDPTFSTELAFDRIEELRRDAARIRFAEMVDRPARSTLIARSRRTVGRGIIAAGEMLLRDGSPSVADA